MKKKWDILYEWPLAELNRLAASSVADEFASTLSGNALDAFTAVTERLRGLATDLAGVRDRREYFGRWTDVNVNLEEFEANFPTFPNGSLRMYRLFALLAEKNSQPTATIDDIDIDDDAYEMRVLSAPLPQSWLCRESSAPEGSMVVFSCSDFSSLHQELDASNISPGLTYQVLAALSRLLATPQGHCAVIPVSTAPIAAVEAFVRLAILATGRTVHQPRHHMCPPSVINADAIKVGPNYHQWNDVIAVLSEYNSRNDVLLKFLTIYHVIENVMFKFPIVQLEQTQVGRMFSIRDFRRLYRQVEQKEISALKQLFGAVFQLPASPGTTFAQHVSARWANLAPSISANLIDDALVALDLQFKHGDLAGGRTVECFSHLVYNVRNAIVHNKETEFHLTYASLDNTLGSLLESFLLPSLEEVSFALVGSPNKHVWYANRELRLYE